MFHMPVIILLIIVCLMRTGMNLQSPVVDRRTALSALQGALIKLNEFYKDDDSIKFAGLRASRKDRIYSFKVNNDKVLLELGMTPEIAKALFQLDKDSKEELVKFGVSLETGASVNRRSIHINVVTGSIPDTFFAEVEDPIEASSMQLVSSATPSRKKIYKQKHSPLKFKSLQDQSRPIRKVLESALKGAAPGSIVK